jgi:predicted heme/steroid binding protein/uncharacterized membrane protein
LTPFIYATRIWLLVISGVDETGEGENKNFTESELEKYDGKNGKPVYISLDGKVHDVSDSSLWADGRHMGLHSAGAELSESIANAPHSGEVLSRFPVVGVLIEEGPASKTLTQRVAALYPHPIVVHFPIAFSTTVSLFSVLYLLTGEASFDMASYYILTLGLLVSPFCGLTGAFSWKVNYRGVRSDAFSRKIRFTLALLAITLVCFIWRTLDPTVLLAKTGMTFVYLSLQVSLALIAAVLGHTGGKIVFSK